MLREAEPGAGREAAGCGCQWGGVMGGVAERIPNITACGAGGAHIAKANAEPARSCARMAVGRHMTTQK